MNDKFNKLNQSFVNGFSVYCKNHFLIKTVSTGSISDALELDDGSILLCGMTGKVNGPIKPSESQRLSYNWYSSLYRISGDGCLLDYPCTDTKLYLQPSRVLPFFNPNNKWWIFDPNSSNKLFARFSKETKKINQHNYYELQFSSDSQFSSISNALYYRAVNERIYSLDKGNDRLVFDYHIFKSEELNDTISLDTSYFIHFSDTIKARQFIYHSNYDTTMVYHYINGIGCIEDFTFNSYAPDNDLPIYQICKFWKNNNLIYVNENLLCTPDNANEIILDDISISPNPTDGIISIFTKKLNTKLYIYNLTGDLITSGGFSRENAINMSNYKPGIYLFVVKDSVGRIVKTEKVVKQ